MPAPASSAPLKQWTTSLFEDRGAGLRKDITVTSAAIPTAAGNLDVYTIVPEDGYLHSVEFSGTDALTASDTNHVTWAITNLGQSGTGAVELLATGFVNSTRATGGSALLAHTRRSFTTIRPMPAVLAGDRLRIRATTLGTLPNAVNGPVYLLRFNP